MEISLTRLRIYRECPWKYKLMFVDGRKIPLTPASALGLSLHRALAYFHRNPDQELGILLEGYESRWVEGGSLNRETRAQWYEKGRRILEKYFEQEQSRRTRIASVEEEFICPLGRHMARGMIDRLDQHPDGKYEIIDYKTQLGPYEDFAASKISPSENMQLRFYALGLRECRGITPGLLTIHYLAPGLKTSAAYDCSGEGELKRLIVETADRIEAGNFRPDTFFCQHCDFRKTCPHSIVH